MKKINHYFFLKAAGIVLLSVFVSCHSSTSTSSSASSQDKKQVADSLGQDDEDSALLKQFSPGDLKTNWTKHSIPLDSIHDGGPPKNGIPAIDYPVFVSVKEASQFLAEPDFGILLDVNGEQRFYPFNIMEWHEIVNDRIGDRAIAVTFCPLCGSGIVFDRTVDGDTLSFGVSGKLFESNLLMFDAKTESLWSQQLGECVVGDKLGKKLSIINSVITSYEDIEKYFPNAGVLSIKTGYDRNYSEYPYADYNASEELYFPVSKTNHRYNNKDEMYVVVIGNSSVAFHWKDLLGAGKATQKTPNGTIDVAVTNNIPSATQRENGNQLNGYFSYWFSWYVMHGENGMVWGK